MTPFVGLDLDRSSVEPDGPAPRVAPGTFEYVLRFDAGTELRFSISVDRDTRSDGGAHAERFWTRLDYHQCENCPLATASDASCPPAVDSSHILDEFAHALSHELCDVTVLTNDRSYAKRCSVQSVLRSILGLVMATSGCPHLRKLRGMAHHHLPFSTIQETVYRTTANHLLRQYFIRRRGGAAEMDLSGLRQQYAELEKVNEAFVRRIRAAAKRDANVNALLNLLSVAMLVGVSLDDGLKELESLLCD